MSVIYAGHAHEAGSFGVRARFDGIDMAGVNAYKDKVVGRLWKGLQSTIASRKVEVARSMAGVIILAVYRAEASRTEVLRTWARSKLDPIK